MQRKIVSELLLTLILAGLLCAHDTTAIVAKETLQLVMDVHTLALWHFDEGTGSVVYDSTTNNNDGAISGATWTTGKYGSALYFHGGGQFHDGDDVTVLHSPSLNITGPFTVEAWIKAKGSDTYLAIVDKYFSDHVSINKGFTLYLSNGKLRFSIYSGATSVDVQGASDIRDDVWHHVAGVWDGNNARVYVDHRLENEVSWTLPPASTAANLGIGKRLSGWGGYLPFLGTIDEVRISDFARDEALVINVPADYSTIQNAIDAAFPNNIIHVWNGTYFENVRIATSSLRLIGQGKSNTIIDGTGVGNVIIVTDAENVAIMGFTLINSGSIFPNSGIFLNHSSGDTVWGNDIWDNVVGIFMSNSFDNDVRGNIVHENFYGIWSMDSGSSYVVANNITDNSILNIDSSNCSNSFFYNNIVNPSPGQVDEWGPAISMWDDGGAHPCPICSGPRPKGNYWGDYMGLDNGLGPPTPSGHKCANDGVGDTVIPHMPATGAPPSDWYPSMNLWGPNPGDVNLDGKVDMKDIGFVARRFGIFWSDIIWDLRADISGPPPGIPDGKVDMRDVGLAASNFGYTDA